MPGRFLVKMIEQDLSRAEVAMANGDIADMIEMYRVLEEYKE